MISFYNFMRLRIRIMISL